MLIPNVVLITGLILFCLLLAFATVLLIVRGTINSTMGQGPRSDLLILIAVGCILLMQFSAFLAGILW